MKSVQAFVAGMLVGVLLTYGGGIALRHLARYGVTEQGHMLAPAGILSALKDMHRELDDLTHPPKPPSSFFALRRPIVRSLRMTKSDVVLTLPVQVSMNATVTASPVIAGNTEQSQHNQTVQTAPEAFEVAKSVSASQAAIIPQAVGPKSFRAAAVPPKAAKQASPVRTPEQQYASALKSYEARRYEQAREQFAVFMDTFGDHKLLPNALYWTGETWYAQGRYERAVQAFAQVVQSYPRHAKSPDALLKQAYAAMRQGRMDQARTYLDRLEGSYPNSQASRLGRQARSKLQGRNEFEMLVMACG
jgi:tol-pal system protein YbgF